MCALSYLSFFVVLLDSPRPPHTHNYLCYGQPFADPNAKKKYTEIEYGQHVYTTARSLVASTLFGVALTCGKGRAHVCWGRVVAMLGH